MDNDIHIKGADLCERCRYSEERCEPPGKCERCQRREITIPGQMQCLCNTVRFGTPCQNFEEADG